MKGFAVHTSASRLSNRNCGGGFFFAFGAENLSKWGDIGPLGVKRVYSDSDLVGFRHGNGSLTKITIDTAGKPCHGKTPSAACENEYENLAKAIAFYNGETMVRTAPGASWPEKLRGFKKTTTASQQNKDKQCYNCYYSIKVRKAFKLPLRTYIWKGGKGFDANNDGEIKDIVANHNAVPPVIASEETTVDWCFEYGEQDWFDGEVFDDMKKKALGNLVLKKKPVGRIDCKTGALLP